MSLARAGGLTTLLLTVIVTAGLIGFEDWYSSFTTSDIVKRLLLIAPISLIAVAPLAFAVFPLVHAGFSRTRGAPPSARTFALIGGVYGTMIAGYAVFRFRELLATSPSIMLMIMTLFVLAATLAGIFGGFIFARLARKEA